MRKAIWLGLSIWLMSVNGSAAIQNFHLNDEYQNLDEYNAEVEKLLDGGYAVLPVSTQGLSSSVTKPHLINKPLTLSRVAHPYRFVVRVSLRDHQQTPYAKLTRIIPDFDHWLLPESIILPITLQDNQGKVERVNRLVQTQNYASIMQRFSLRENRVEDMILPKEITLHALLVGLSMQADTFFLVHHRVVAISSQHLLPQKRLAIVDLTKAGGSCAAQFTMVDLYHSYRGHQFEQAVCLKSAEQWLV